MADVTDRKAVKKMINAAIGAFGSVDILVCNASARSQKPFTEMTYEEWRRVIDISLDGSFFLAQAAVLSMIEKSWGRIVTLGGISWHVGTPGRVHNLVAKSGLVGFTRGLAVELAQLEYSLPRLKHLWTHLSRMKMGVGMRGPGEKQLETDRRLVEKRIVDLRRELKVIEGRKERQVSSRHDLMTVSLVGYTNAGKSTLMNILTSAGVVTADK